MANMDGVPGTERLDLSIIRDRLATRRLGKAPGWDNELWESLDSTNNRAAELAGTGAPEGVIVLARQQTAGRGRQGRTWISPPDCGIYMSYLLRPARNRSDLPLHTLACGVACAQAIRECSGITIGLKWVNDLVSGGKKVGGILAEIPSFPGNQSAVGEQSLVLVLGIGINLRLDQSQVPEDLRSRVDSLENLAGQPVDPNLLVAATASQLEQTLYLLEQGKHAQVLDAWRQHSVTLGRKIRAISATSEIEGTAVDIDETGGLVVETTTQGSITLHAGEISIRNLDGTYA